MESFSSKALPQNRNASMSSPLINTAVDHRMIRLSQPPPLLPQYRSYVYDDMEAYDSYKYDVDMSAVDDDMEAYDSYKYDVDMSAVWAPYRHSQVLNRSSPVIKDQNYYSTKFAPANSDWSPLDDGIEINPTFTTSRENFIACVDYALYGPSQRKRLPVFTNICPE